MTPSVEKIVELRPDLVIGDLATTIPRERVALMERAGLSVILFRIRSLADMLDRITTLGKLCGRERRAKALVKTLDTRIGLVKRAVRSRLRPTVLFVVWPDPLWTIGRLTFLHDLIEAAGGKNLAGDLEKEGVRLGLEEVVIRDPDVIVMATHDPRGAVPAAWGMLRAVRTNRVYPLRAEGTLHASPRLVDALERLARLLHPSAFKIPHSQHSNP